jgi:arsenical pump membrane protein
MLHCQATAAIPGRAGTGYDAPMPAASSARSRQFTRRLLSPEGPLASPAPYATVAALVLLASGLVSWGGVASVFRLTWDATTTLVALMILSRLLAEAGLFRWAAWRAVAALRGSTLATFAATIALSALVSALFTNDGTVLLLTPVLAELCVALQLPPAATLAVLVANGFIADFCSTPLVSSNLVNILAVDATRLSLATYARAMVPPTLAALGVAAVTLFLVFRRDLGHAATAADPRGDQGGRPGQSLPHAADRPWGPWDPGAVGEDGRGTNLHPVGPDRPLSLAGVAVMAVAATGFVVTATRHVPTAAILGPAALAYWLFGAYRLGAVRAWRVARAAPWDVILFAIAMSIVILAVDRSGLGHGLWTRVHSALRGRRGRVVAFGSLAAVTAALINNLPSTLFWLVAMRPRPGAVATAPHTAGPAHPALGHLSRLTLALVAGSDIGPKLTPIGSLATLIWMRELRRRDIPCTWGRYMRWGLVLTPPTLLAFLLVLSWIR